MKFKTQLLNSRRSVKNSLIVLTELFCLYFSLFLAIYFSFAETSELTLSERRWIFLLPVLSIFVFYLSGVYRQVVRFISFSAIYAITRAILIALIFNLFLTVILIKLESNTDSLAALSFGIDFRGIFVGLISSIILIIGSRLLANYYFSNKSSAKKVIIYGAGSAGVQLSSALRVSREMEPIAFVDNNSALQGSYVGDLKVLNPKKVQKFIKRNNVEEVLIAMPSASKATLNRLFREIESYSVKVRILPDLAELAEGKVLVSELKEVRFNDLLDRVEIEPNQLLLDKNIKNKVVLITGAGGSIGSEISKQVAVNSPSKIILLDINEFSLYSIEQEIQNSGKDCYAILADVKDRSRMNMIISSFKVDTIYHAAAYKHVSLVEKNPFEAVLNNIIGTQVSLEVAIENKVSTFVLISTDKAVRPTNIMGASKRFAELILQSKSHDMKSSETIITMVRFGNVVGSSGSAIPLFQRQIKEGGPVTVTDPEVVRYFMTIPEAAELVIQAGALGNGGDVFLLDMGKPVKIYEIAKRLIQLSGMELKDKDNLNGDIEIIFTGLKPGEKLYEELLISADISPTSHKNIQGRRRLSALEGTRKLH